MAVTGTPRPAPCPPSPVAPGHAPGVTAPWEPHTAGGKTERAWSSPKSGHRAEPGIPLPGDIAVSPQDPAAVGHHRATLGSRCCGALLRHPHVPLPWDITVSPTAGTGDATGHRVPWSRAAGSCGHPAGGTGTGPAPHGAAARDIPAPGASAPACQARRKRFIYRCYFQPDGARPPAGRRPVPRGGSACPEIPIRAEPELAAPAPQPHRWELWVRAGGSPGFSPARSHGAAWHWLIIKAKSVAGTETQAHLEFPPRSGCGKGQGMMLAPQQLLVLLN